MEGGQEVMRDRDRRGKGVRPDTGTLKVNVIQYAPKPPVKYK